MVVDPAGLLRQRGIQITAQRLAVMRAVARRPHVTADEVAASVKREIGAISLQSVYDALGVLSAAGLIRRIEPAGSPARFEDRVGDNHHHLICRICGRTVDVECAVGVAPCLNAADDRGYQIDEAEVIYWGRCAKCAKRAETTKVTKITKLTKGTEATSWTTKRSARSRGKRTAVRRTRTGGRSS